MKDLTAVEEIPKGTTVDVTIPVDTDAARALKGGRARGLIEEAIAEAKREACARGPDGLGD